MSPGERFFGGIELVGRLVFVLLWAWVAWVDWREKKIRHRHLLWGLMAAAAGYALLAVQTAAGRRAGVGVFFTPEYYRALAAYVGLSTGAALLLWRLRVWPAGDAKLFALLSTLYPLTVLKGSFDATRLPLIALINTFLPAAAWVFLQSARYVWRTRLAHYLGFYAALGWGRLGGFARESLAALPGAASQGLAALLSALRDPATYAESATWVAGMAMIAVLSHRLSQAVSNMLAMTLLCFGLFYLWGLVIRALGRGPALLVAAGAVAGALRLWPPADWSELGVALAQMALFSALLFAGTKLMWKLMSGQVALLPVSLLGFVAGPILGLVAGHLRGGWGSTLLVWALMGLTFGLAMVFVRIWDEEVALSARPEEIAPFVVLAPRFVARLKEDEDFFAEHMDPLYADGLTPDQAEAVKSWCADKGVEEVPLTPTVSFAFWIFLGYFLTWALGRHVLQ